MKKIAIVAAWTDATSSFLVKDGDPEAAILFAPVGYAVAPEKLANFSETEVAEFFVDEDKYQAPVKERGGVMVMSTTAIAPAPNITKDGKKLEDNELVTLKKAEEAPKASEKGKGAKKK